MTQNVKKIRRERSMSVCPDGHVSRVRGAANGKPLKKINRVNFFFFGYSPGMIECMQLAILPKSEVKNMFSSFLIPT